MPQKRVNYGRMYQKNSSRRHDSEAEEPKDEAVEEVFTNADPEIVEESPRCRYRKTTTSKIRIRKGPGLNFKHNGEYVSEDEIVIVKVEKGFGLLAEYEKASDGWVSMEYFELVD